MKRVKLFIMFIPVFLAIPVLVLFLMDAKSATEIGQIYLAWLGSCLSYVLFIIMVYALVESDN